MTQRYLVAKYASDVFRMEPKNIGIILWADGNVCAKFLDDAKADFIADKEVYSRWTSYWNRLINERAISNGRLISADEPAFLDALLKKQEGNYLLLDAGRVIDDIGAEGIQSAAEFLFSELVAPIPEAQQGADDKLTEAIETIFDDIGLKEREDWKGSTTVKCWVKGLLHEFSFSYVLATDRKTNAVFQKVPINRKQSVNSAAFMMEWVGTSKVVKTKQRRAAIVDTSEGDNEANEHAIAMLGQFAHVINIADQKEARKQILKVTTKLKAS